MCVSLLEGVLEGENKMKEGSRDCLPCSDKVTVQHLHLLKTEHIELSFERIVTLFITCIFLCVCTHLCLCFKNGTKILPYHPKTIIPAP